MFTVKMAESEFMTNFWLIILAKMKKKHTLKKKKCIQIFKKNLS